MNTIPKLNLGIAAYNSQANIKHLLASVLVQKQERFILEKIIVHSDASSDNTIAQAQTLKDPRIVIIDRKERGGFANAVKTILGSSNSDLTILLNDDIIIEDSDFLNKAIESFYTNDKLGLASVSAEPLASTNFIESAGVSAFRVYNRVFSKVNNGRNVYTCDGKVLILSKNFKDGLKFPEDVARMGCVDSYLYFLCMSKDFEYAYVNNIRVFYKCPGTVADYISWTLRNTAERAILEKEFPVIAKKDFSIPLGKFMISILRELVLNPFGIVFLVCSNFYIKFKLLFGRSANGHLWDTVATTKSIKINYNEKY